jgi:acetyltransferase-like isoleucine patch superfamily enzyme
MSRHLEHDWFSEPLPENIQLGERTWLYSTYAFRHYRSRRPVGVRAGHDTGLYNGTFFDLGPEGEVMIGDFCTIVGAIISTNGRVSIGNYTFIAHEVILADSAFSVPLDAHSLLQDCAPRLTPAAPRSIRLGENVWVGTRAVLLSGANVGEGAIIGAGAVVDCEIPPFCVVAGNPARLVKKLDPSNSPTARTVKSNDTQASSK